MLLHFLIPARCSPVKDCSCITPSTDLTYGRLVISVRRVERFAPIIQMVLLVSERPGALVRNSYFLLFLLMEGPRVAMRFGVTADGRRLLYRLSERLAQHSRLSLIIQYSAQLECGTMRHRYSSEEATGEASLCLVTGEISEVAAAAQRQVDLPFEPLPAPWVEERAAHPALQFDGGCARVEMELSMDLADLLILM